MPGSFLTRPPTSRKSPLRSSSSTAATAARPRRRLRRRSSRSISPSAASPRRRTKRSPAGKEKPVLIDRRLASHFDWTLLGITVGLIILGILTIYSATYSVTEHRASGLASKQFYWFLIGVAAMVGASTFDYHRVDRIAYPFYGAVLLLLA